MIAALAAPQAGGKNGDHRPHMRDVITAELEIMFRRDNSQFDTARFKQACKPGANVKSRKAA